MALPQSSTEILGARLLKEIASEEGSLEDVCLLFTSSLIDNDISCFYKQTKNIQLLKSLHQTSIPNPSKTGIQTLDTFWSHNGGKLSVTGRGLPFLYHILTSLLTKLHGTVALLDLTARFSPSHLHISVSELKHLHVFKPTQANLKATLESVESYMLYGEHGSKGRQWVGTVVVGGIGGDINIGWRGWLRVEREEVAKFADGVGVEEVWGEKGMRQRQEVVDKASWRADCEFGSYCWK